MSQRIGEECEVVFDARLGVLYIGSEYDLIGRAEIHSRDDAFALIEAVRDAIESGFRR